jgi:hypothetical protein
MTIGRPMKARTPIVSDQKPIRMSAKLIYKGHLPVAGHSLNEMTAVAHLYGPWRSNDMGRWKVTRDSIIRIPGLSQKAVTQAINSLIERRIIAKWTIDNQDCYELAGAYAAKGLASATARRKIDAAMHPPTLADETTSIDRIEEVRKVVNRKNGPVELSTPPAYFNDIPGPGKNRNKLLLQPPGKVGPNMLRMVSPHNVYEKLTPLGCCIRLMLEMVADDLGRSVIDIDDLSSRLGRKIMGRSSKQSLRQEIDRMAKDGHLKVFERGGVTCAYIRDAAQPAMRNKRLTPDLPLLYPEHPEWTLDSPENQLFYARNFEAAARNKLVATSFEFTDKAGTRLNVMYRPMSFFADQLHKTLAVVQELAGGTVTDHLVRQAKWDEQTKFFMAVDCDLEELALEIYYEDVCNGQFDRPRLTTLDTESRGGNFLVPALFEMRYGLSLQNYVAAMTAKWLPRWDTSPTKPYALQVYESAQSIEASPTTL